MTNADGNPDAGFEAVLDRLARLTEHEREHLRLQAETAELGHSAYALGQTYLWRGELAQAERWLDSAARYDVPGARRALAELAIESAIGAAAIDVKRAAAEFGADDDTSPVRTLPRNSDVAGFVLPASQESLARGVPPSAPGTVFALTLSGGFAVGPRSGRRVMFGRRRPEVHVCLGEDDPRVSRTQGFLEYVAERWRVHNTGRLPIRVADRLLFQGEQPVALDAGYTQLFVRTGSRQHLLEVFVTDANGQRPVARHEEVTVPPRTWRLTEDERLVLVVLGQRYLQHEPNPQPLSWRQIAEELDHRQPQAEWTAKRAATVVLRVRERLSRSGVPGLTRAEVGDPVGNLLNHNLIQELLMTTTLVPMDLALIDSA